MYGPCEPLSDCRQDQTVWQLSSAAEADAAGAERRDVGIAIDRLERAAHQLNHSIHALAPRLVPVLRPEPADTPPQAQGEQQEPKCPLVLNLDGVRQTLMGARTIADYLIDHLAL